MGILDSISAIFSESYHTVEHWFESGPASELAPVAAPDLDPECSSYATRVGNSRVMFGDQQPQRFFQQDYSQCIASRAKPAQEQRLVVETDTEKGIKTFLGQPNELMCPAEPVCMQ